LDISCPTAYFVNVIYNDMVTGRRVGAGLRRRVPLPPRSPVNAVISGIAGPAGPLFNSMEISFPRPGWPSDGFNYEYISPLPGWGIGAYLYTLTTGAISPQGYSLGVAFNALYRNDPSLTVLKSPI
jgi:hypothetical protein